MDILFVYSSQLAGGGSLGFGLKLCTSTIDHVTYAFNSKSRHTLNHTSETQPTLNVLCR